MLKYAALISSLAIALSLAIPGKPIAPVGPWQVDPRHSDAQLITDATTNYGKTKINYTVGIARVTGRVKIDDDNPAQSSFDFTMYPSTSTMPPIGEDGKVKSAWFSNYANHTLICFHSKGTSRTSEGRLRTTGTLVVTRVDRNVELNPGEAYSGPVYGPPMIHRVSHEATFVFDPPSPSGGAKNDSKDLELVTSGSTGVVTEDFPQLFKVVTGTYWPPVVQDENCKMPSMTSEDYSGPHCTGTFMVAPGLPVEPRAPAVGEDYPVADSGFNAIVGNHMTIAVHLRLSPVASESHAATGK